jgi:polyisoprenoid-binding protein YceI
MQRIKRIPILVLAALAVVASFVLAAPGDLAVKPTSKLWITGKSTLHDFTSQATQLRVAFQQDSTRWPEGPIGVEAVERFIREKGVTSMDVIVGVTGMRSEKDGLDKNMYKALKADTYPEIRFGMGSYEAHESGTPAGMTIDAKGMLTVAGVEREITVAVTAVRDGETMHLRGNVPLLMTQFGIKPPKMMLGTIRTADEIVVHFDLVVGAKDAAVAISKAE